MYLKCFICIVLATNMPLTIIRPAELWFKMPRTILRLNEENISFIQTALFFSLQSWAQRKIWFLVAQTFLFHNLGNIQDHILNNFISDGSPKRS